MSFIINNQSWEIIELNQREIKEMQNKRKATNEEQVDSVYSRYFGITLFDDLKIYLDKDLALDKKKQTLLHELTHCYIGSYITHTDKSYNEEDVCDIVSNSHKIISDIYNEYFK